MGADGVLILSSRLGDRWIFSGKMTSQRAVRLKRPAQIMYFHGELDC